MSDPTPDELLLRLLDRCEAWRNTRAIHERDSLAEQIVKDVLDTHAACKAGHLPGEWATAEKEWHDKSFMEERRIRRVLEAELAEARTLKGLCADTKCGGCEGCKHRAAKEEITKLKVVLDAARPTVQRLNSHTLFTPTWDQRVALAQAVLHYDFQLPATGDAP